MFRLMYTCIRQVDGDCEAGPVRAAIQGVLRAGATCVGPGPAGRRQVLHQAALHRPLREHQGRE